MMRSCERRSFDAATIFIALVICCVFFTARIRRRRSISEGICPRLAAEAGSGCRRLPRREVLRELLPRALERGPPPIGQLRLLAGPPRPPRGPRFHVRDPSGLPAAHSH